MASANDPLDIDALFTSADEKTFQHDESLPSLPVPDLQHTLDRYLDSGKQYFMFIDLYTYMYGLVYAQTILDSCIMG